MHAVYAFINEIPGIEMKAFCDDPVTTTEAPPTSLVVWQQAFRKLDGALRALEAKGAPRGLKVVFAKTKILLPAGAPQPAAGTFPQGVAVAAGEGGGNPEAMFPSAPSRSCR